AAADHGTGRIREQRTRLGAAAVHGEEKLVLAHVVSVTFERPRGASGGTPRARANACAQSCPGTTATIGVSHSGTPAGIRRAVVASANTSSRSERAIIPAFRARPSWRI